MEAVDVPTNREQLLARISARARSDAEWADLLRRDPKAAVEAELGVRLPDDLNVLLVEETPSLMCILLPRHSDGIHPGAAASLRGVRTR